MDTRNKRLLTLLGLLLMAQERAPLNRRFYTLAPRIRAVCEQLDAESRS